MGALFSLNVQRFVNFNTYRSIYKNHALFPFMLTGATPLECFNGLIQLNQRLYLVTNQQVYRKSFQALHSSCDPTQHRDRFIKSFIAVSIGLYQADRLRKIHD
jgi:hypothetical protein